MDPKEAREILDYESHGFPPTVSEAIQVILAEVGRLTAERRELITALSDLQYQWICETDFQGDPSLPPGVLAARDLLKRLT